MSDDTDDFEFKFTDRRGPPALNALRDKLEEQINNEVIPKLQEELEEDDEV